MSRQVRHRVTALALGGLLLGTPLLATGTANAEQVEGGGRQVVFGGGGVLGLSCRSRPNVESVTVPSDSTVRLVNRTGHSARLMLGGSSKGTVPDDGSTEVVFRRGTTSVLLTPNCAIGRESTPVLVTATPTPGVPGPIPGPPTAPVGPPAVPLPSDTDLETRPPTSTGRPGSPGAATTPTRQGSTATGRPKPDRPRPPRATAPRPTAKTTAVRTRAAQAMPPGGSAPQARTRTTSRGTRAASPAFSGMPPGDEQALLSGVPTVDLSQSTGVSDPVSVPPTQVVAAEQVATLEPIPARSRIGLLAAIATICVLGVGIGAIRTIVSQRASRATIA